MKKELTKKFPKKKIEYYKTQVQKQIEKKKRKYYRGGANIALNIKEIYEEQLNSPSRWENYIEEILNNYPRHTALQDEFKSICLN